MVTFQARPSYDLFQFGRIRGRSEWSNKRLTILLTHTTFEWLLLGEMPSQPTMFVRATLALDPEKVAAGSSRHVQHSDLEILSANLLSLGRRLRGPLASHFGHDCSFLFPPMRWPCLCHRQHQVVRFGSQNRVISMEWWWVSILMVSPPGWKRRNEAIGGIKLNDIASIPPQISPSLLFTLLSWLFFLSPQLKPPLGTLLRSVMCSHECPVIISGIFISHLQHLIK